MTNDEIRKVFEYWAQSEQIEHYKKPIISERFQAAFINLMIGVFIGFIAGMLVAAMIGG